MAGTSSAVGRRREKAEEPVEVAERESRAAFSFPPSKVVNNDDNEAIYGHGLAHVLTPTSRQFEFFREFASPERSRERWLVGGPPSVGAGFPFDRSTSEL